MGMVRSAVRRAEDQERAPGLGSGSGRMPEVSLRVPPWEDQGGTAAWLLLTALTCAAQSVA